jgi:HPt (histidine-containing phosphotransfer) domain-containing protein
MSDIPPDAAPALDLLRTVGGDAMIATMMQTFLRFAEERVAKLDDELRSNRLAEVASIAHSLKSSARQLGAIALGEACAAAEAAGKSGDGSATTAGVEAIRREFEAARPWMTRLATGASS